MQLITYKILGMHCGACQKIIERKIAKITGVSQVTVKLEGGEVIVLASRHISLDEVKQSLEGTDYIVSIPS